jgi:leader peptidase (prepilin peptidase)/N-methyltransferase
MLSGSQITVFFEVLVFMLGALFGSFFALCVHRIPRELSIVRPPSRCEDCKKEIPAYQNIPVLSYLLLRGKCGSCGAKIGIRNWLIEVGSGLVALLLWRTFSLPGEQLMLLDGPEIARSLWPFLASFIFFGGILIAGLIDLETMMLPNVITMPGIPIGILLSQALPGHTWQNSLWGAAIGAGFIEALRRGYRKLAGREGVGEGDTYLLGVLGGFLGASYLPLLLLLSSLQGAIIGIVMALYAQKKIKEGADEESLRHYQIPFGTFLGLASFEILLFGDDMMRWYWGLI